MEAAEPSPEAAATDVSAAEGEPQGEDVVCLHDEDWEEGDVTEMLGDTPRFDFYFDKDTTEEQRTAVYRAALFFSTALPPGRVIDDEDVDGWMESCQVSVTGCGGPGDAIEEDEEEGEDAEEGEVRDEGGAGALRISAPPFALAFPTARRVSDFLAFLVHAGPFTLWNNEREGDEQVEEEDDYQPQVRLFWRMDLSDWIPLYA